MTVYHDLFSDWASVVSEFSAGNVKEPDEVLFAAYSYEDYSGDALVIYRNGDRYFVVDGGHCSCYGLEGQWTPEEYSLPLLFAALEKRGSHGLWGAHSNDILTNLRERIAAGT